MWEGDGRPKSRCNSVTDRQFERAKQCAAMGYHGESRSRYFISGRRPATRDSIELFHAIGAVVPPTGVYRKPLLQRVAEGSNGDGTGAEKERRKRATSERRRVEDNGQGRRGIRIRRKRENHSTFYTSGYCIRIYYNLRIPEENDSGRELGARSGGRAPFRGKTEGR